PVLAATDNAYAYHAGQFLLSPTPIAGKGLPRARRGPKLAAPDLLYLLCLLDLLDPPDPPGLRDVGRETPASGLRRFREGGGVPGTRKEFSLEGPQPSCRANPEHA